MTNTAFFSDKLNSKLTETQLITEQIVKNSIEILDRIVDKKYAIKNHILLASVIKTQTELFTKNS